VKEGQMIPADLIFLASSLPVVIPLHCYAIALHCCVIALHCYAIVTLPCDACENQGMCKCCIMLRDACGKEELFEPLKLTTGQLLPGPG
jgi:hypothetical protein